LRDGPANMTGASRAATLCKALLGLSTVAVFVFASTFHEFWRDELQAALIARAVPLGELVPAMRIEAVPPVVYLALKAVMGLPVPYSLSVLAPAGYACLLFGTYRLLLTLSGSKTRSLVVTVLLGLTDTYFYELGVVVRQYGLGLGLALACVGFLGSALARRDDDETSSDAWWGALAGAVAGSTAIHPGCVAGAALLSYAVIRLAQRRTVRAVLEPLCALPAFLFTFFLIGPYDRAPVGLVERHPPLVDAMEGIGRTLADGLVCRGWWSDWREPYAIDAPRLVAMGAVTIALIGLVLLRVPELRRGTACTLFYAGTLVLSAATLSYVFVVRYEGAYRHHLFLVMPALVVGLGVMLGGRPPREAHGGGLVAFGAITSCLCVWFGYQYFACTRDLRGDYGEAFGSAKGASAVFPRGARAVIAGDDWMAAGIEYYRPDIALRATTSMGRPVHYQILDWHWHDEVPLRPLLGEECGKASPSPIYVIARGGAPDAIAPCARLVASPPSHLPTERFNIYELPCTCAALATNR
jgi:hypothetical protein